MAAVEQGAQPDALAPAGDGSLQAAIVREPEPWEKYTDLDRLKYVLALFFSLLAVLVGITYRWWPLIIVGFVCVWVVDKRGRDVYRSFRRRRRRIR